MSDTVSNLGIQNHLGRVGRDVNPSPSPFTHVHTILNAHFLNFQNKQTDEPTAQQTDGLSDRRITNGQSLFFEVGTQLIAI